jgi:hypothetical protein
MQTETTHAGGFIASEANGSRSREIGTIASGQGVLLAGTVLGLLAVGSASATAGAGNTGDGVMGAIAVGANAKPGDYTLTFVEPAADAGAFVVEDPEGINVGSGDADTEFSGGGLTFTLADGATDFAAGDTFTITVAEGSGEHAQLDPAGEDGSEAAAAVLFADVDATDVAAEAVLVVRDAEVVTSDLVWPDGITDNQKATALAQLKRLGLIAR